MNKFTINFMFKYIFNNIIPENIKKNCIASSANIAANCIVNTMKNLKLC